MFHFFVLLQLSETRDIIFLLCSYLRKLSVARCVSNRYVLPAHARSSGEFDRRENYSRTSITLDHFFPGDVLGMRECTNVCPEN